MGGTIFAHGVRISSNNVSINFLTSMESSELMQWWVKLELTFSQTLAAIVAVVMLALIVVLATATATSALK